jgi:hypothetical protein
MQTPDAYRQRGEAAQRAAEAATDAEAKRMLIAAAERWRQLADIALRILAEEQKRL